MTNRSGPSSRELLIALFDSSPEVAFLGELNQPPPWDWMDAPLRQSFAVPLDGMIKGWQSTGGDLGALLRSVNALRWEYDCMKLAAEEGETLSAAARRLIIPSNTCPRYTEKQSLEEAPRDTAVKVKIQNDVPILRQTEHGLLPYVVEAKCAQLHPYGQAYGFGKNVKGWLGADAPNQLLRYQFAIDQGKIAGATLELKGPVHSRMLEWMLHGLDGQGTRIPDLEVVWSLPLPSGAHARVWLKQGPGNGRLLRESVENPADQPALEAFQRARSDFDALKRIVHGSISPDWSGLPASLLETRPTPLGNLVRMVDEPGVIGDLDNVRAFLQAQQNWVASGAGVYEISVPAVSFTEKKRAPRGP